MNRYANLPENRQPKYQVININGDITIDFNAANWAVVNTRTDKVIKDKMTKHDAMDYARGCVEDDNWNASNR